MLVKFLKLKSLLIIKILLKIILALNKQEKLQVTLNKYSKQIL